MEEKIVVTTPLDLRQINALEFVKRHEEISTNVDAVRKAIVFLARHLGWADPQNKEKATQ
jgi:hypothetical protein